MFHAVIPAGGAGTRLWPLSRKDRPKFLLDLTGEGETLLQKTATRLGDLPSSITVMCGQAHVAQVARQLPDARLLVEPSAQGTMAAIAAAAALAYSEDENAVIGSFAADHHIGDEATFRRAVTQAIAYAQEGNVVTLGIRPTSASTAYGYIQQGDYLNATAPQEPSTYRAARFVEKPQARIAQEFLNSGEYVWNAGIFVFSARVLLDALSQFHPEIYTPVMAAVESYKATGEFSAQLWAEIPNAVIDRAIAEPLAERGKVCVIPTDMDWSDIGDFASLAELVDSPVQAVPGGALHGVIRVNSSLGIAYTSSKPMVIVGIDNAVVVDTPDALLVTTIGSAQDVKTAVESLKIMGMGKLT